MFKTSALILVALLAVSCGKKSFPTLEYMPDMYRQASLKAQEQDPNSPNGIGMRVPPAGTMPVNFEPYTLGLLDTTEANALVNPLTPTEDVLETGRKYYNTYCVVCHGVTGDGKGYIIPKFTMPPSLLAEKAVGWPDGRIYHTIMMGQGLMPSYKQQVPTEKRWAIIHYIRALQRAAHPLPQDSLAMANGGFSFKDDAPDTARAVLWPNR
ncbi:MAG: cytochrome c [Calditrichaeota bacterium]|nr:cytochrome c [Calditrichota bacterium]MCB9365791.1 cytochrome c [Calditrichota bacterium]